MLIGEDKYACDACIRGHRAIKCDHSDRPLTYISKRGRPVTQCSHCRTLRKSRSAHVKCDCGEKMRGKIPCTHGEEGDSKTDTCCCSHGGRCSCALKKTHSHPVLESDLDENSTSMAATTEILPPSTLQASSDTSFFISATSHHVPALKHTEMAHPWALTYNVPRVDSTQCAAPSLLNDSIQNLLYLSTVDAFHGDLQIQNTVFSAQMEQMVIDPELGPLDLINPSNIEPLNSHPPPFDTSSFDSLPSNPDFPLNFNDLDTIHEIDQSLVPANCGLISIDWSHYDV